LRDSKELKPRHQRRPGGDTAARLKHGYAQPEDNPMTAAASPFAPTILRTASLLGLLALAACAQPHSEPQQVQVSNPSVTYKYRTDQELVQANERAAAYCSTYQSTHRTATFGTDPDGSKRVVFDCVKGTAMTPAAPVVAAAPAMAPNLTYTYFTDQELLDASRNAQNYCMSRGSTQVSSTITTNTNGSRTAMFQCLPR